MRLPPRALRHVITYRTAISAVAATAVITSAFTAAAAAFLSAIAVIAVRSELARDPGSQIGAGTCAVGLRRPGGRR
ncbi:MAG TPA: hypothetical protein VN695_01830 [Streptosporangiaceae bacterium]|nr:hypothetical protein [Streptosporangiaceae bacterium]